MNEEQETDLTTRVKQVLIECRVVLPGAQALLGFQLIIMWMTAFYKIPQVMEAAASGQPDLQSLSAPSC